MRSSERFSAVPIDERGTTEEQWQSWLSTREWPQLEVKVDRLIVLAAHPDDEVLGAAGMMIAAAAAGIEVVPVCFSDGAGSHPGSPTLSPEELATRRQEELDVATKVLGISRSRWFGLPDGGLDREHDAMTSIINDICDEWPEETLAVLAVWEHDGHPDHEAVGRCAREVAADRGIELWQYPIWMWHWATPGESKIPWEDMRRHQLSNTALATKRIAITAFDTQINPLSPDAADRPVLLPHILDRLTRTHEYVFG
ncbi:PIG-L deacetylase family protein [Nocardia sp. 348MFTsu5.1]|uniref:PIG-L deacetylase family protein n=1 Tax=Nocardia sp. 348MFTsu5.1 TaxID=1172185 RepID=UPI00035D977A|nr:PIG-L deacetylase family protein [Nocardia sp. 348MFTsu5.1]